jgi:hypothetical protein
MCVIAPHLLTEVIKLTQQIDPVRHVSSAIKQSHRFQRDSLLGSRPSVMSCTWYEDSGLDLPSPTSYISLFLIVVLEPRNIPMFT